MAQILYNDRPEDFKCKVTLEGASLDKSSARILLETQDKILMFKGKIDEEGICTIPIKSLKTLFPEEVSGKMKLEVIAEDAYFTPWEEDITIKPSKALSINETTAVRHSVSKPTLKVVDVKQEASDVLKLCKALNEEGFTKKIVMENREKSIPLLGRVIHQYYKSLGIAPSKGITKKILENL